MQNNPTELKEIKKVKETHPGKHGIFVSIRDLKMDYGDRPVLNGIDLDIEPGEFIAVVGRSGCGKSTLLRLIAGLEKPTAGSIQLDHPFLANNSDTRFMFQEARLLPWKKVLQNVSIGLGTKNLGRACQVLKAVGLSDRGNEWPARLSGGQKQRVSLARALVHRPKLLLLDEPLGALDALTRIEMHQLIESLWRDKSFTALLVTHDVSEAISLADRIIVLEEGNIAFNIKIDLPRPRQRSSERFFEIEEQLLNKILKSN